MTDSLTKSQKANKYLELSESEEEEEMDTTEVLIDELPLQGLIFFI